MRRIYFMSMFQSGLESVLRIKQKGKHRNVDSCNVHTVDALTELVQRTMRTARAAGQPFND